MQQGEMIKPLHGLRGLAAMTVVVGHLAPIKSAPALGVLLFFVISGFLIGKLYLERTFDGASVWSYVVARFARVYPLSLSSLLQWSRSTISPELVYLG